ncbi:MAG: T9SS type A sorting domain-containing protein, partial [Schleiferiaceae bacterium]
ANAGDAINLATEHTVEDFDNLGVILWIQDAVTKEVLQSTDASYTIGQFENELAASLNIYPNPATDRIFVEADFEGEATARLISMLGQEIKAPTATLSAGQRLEISTSDLAPGTYLLVVSKEGTTHATPVIVQ